MGIFNKKMKINPFIKETDIERIHRVDPPKPGFNRPIMIKFASHKIKNFLYTNKKMLKPKSGTKGDLLYLNEDLTTIRASLLFEARKMKREWFLTGCWTTDCKIMILDRKNRVVHIKNKRDLVRYQEQK